MKFFWNLRVYHGKIRILKLSFPLFLIKCFPTFKPKYPIIWSKKALMGPFYLRKFPDQIFAWKFPFWNCPQNFNFIDWWTESLYHNFLFGTLHFYADKFYLTVYIDWERIINDAAVEQDLRIITKFFGSEGFRGKSSDFKSFFETWGISSAFTIKTDI